MRKDKRKCSVRGKKYREGMGILLAVVVAFGVLSSCRMAVSALEKTDTEISDIRSIEELISVLPDEVTGDNAGQVRAQLDEILALYVELSEEEQEQVDVSRCLELQAALDEGNVPDAAVGDAEGTPENGVVPWLIAAGVIVFAGIGAVVFIWRKGKTDNIRK